MRILSKPLKFCKSRKCKFSVFDTSDVDFMHGCNKQVNICCISTYSVIGVGDMNLEFDRNILWYNNKYHEKKTIILGNYMAWPAQILC